MRYIRHQECEIEINNHKFFAKNASLSTASSVQDNRVYGGGLRSYSSISPLEAAVEFSYYITGDQDPLIALTGTHSCTGRFCGIEFSGAYLTDYSVTVSPYKLVEFSAAFSIYSGFKNETTTGSFSTDPMNLANGAYTELLNFNKNNIGLDFPTDIDYSVSCERSPNYILGHEYPQDVRLGKVKKSLSIAGENVGSIINFSGKDFAKISISPKNMNFAARGQTIECEGMISSQNLNISSNGLLNGAIQIIESAR